MHLDAIVSLFSVSCVAEELFRSFILCNGAHGTIPLFLPLVAGFIWQECVHPEAPSIVIRLIRDLRLRARSR